MNKVIVSIVVVLMLVLSFLLCNPALCQDAPIISGQTPRLIVSDPYPAGAIQPTHCVLYGLATTRTTKAEKLADGSVRCRWDISGLKAGSYKVYARARHDSGTSETLEFTK